MFPENCILRIPIPLLPPNAMPVICPTDVLWTSVFGPPRFVWLKKLVESMRSPNETRSVMRNDFISEKSSLIKWGPNIVPVGQLPKVEEAGNRYGPVVHCWLGQPTIHWLRFCVVAYGLPLPTRG